MTLVFLQVNDRTLTWLGVGNVEGVVCHASGGGMTRVDRALLRAGVIGYQLPGTAVASTMLWCWWRDTLADATKKARLTTRRDHTWVQPGLFFAFP